MWTELRGIQFLVAQFQPKQYRPFINFGAYMCKEGKGGVGSERGGVGSERGGWGGRREGGVGSKRGGWGGRGEGGKQEGRGGVGSKLRHACTCGSQRPTSSVFPDHCPHYFSIYCFYLFSI